MTGTVDPYQIIYFNNPLLTRRAEWVYTMELARDINAQHDVIFLGDSMIAHGNWGSAGNYGYGGDTVQLLLQRLDIVINAHPSKVYILVGVNDFFIGANAEWISILYIGLINKLKQHNIEVTVLSTVKCSPIILPTEPASTVNLKINYLNNQLSNLSDVRFVDLNSSLSDNNGLKSIYTDDGVHLTESGYNVVYSLLGEW